MIIEKTILQGSRVRLEPLAATHLPGLAAAIEDGALWELWFTTVPHPRELARFYDLAQLQYQAGRELAFATIDRATGKVLGSTRYRAIEPAHKRLEIGSTFIAKSWQRTHVNSEAKLLMLQHAFETLNFNRVELLTDELNEKSRAAILRLGATQEAILRCHMVMRDGRVRNSVLYSLVADEWPRAKAKLSAALSQTAQPA
jgi:RimJ/RimL family protein N-acetyltransferase